jgi:hypothetical protein
MLIVMSPYDPTISKAHLAKSLQSPVLFYRGQESLLDIVLFSLVITLAGTDITEAFTPTALQIA